MIGTTIGNYVVRQKLGEGGMEGRAMKRLLMAATAAAMLTGGTAFAQDVTPEQQAQAQEYFQKGDTAYNLGRYDEAVEWFTKAYEVWQLNEFLYNIAQSYRLAGNCKQALHFYKRFKSLKERDAEAPLSKKKREEIDKFIAELTDCAAKADTTAQQQPDTLDKPPTGGGDPAPADPHDPPPPTGNDPVATAEPVDDGPVDEPEPDVVDEVVVGPKLLSARVATGLALFSAGDLKVPAQASLALGAGYPLAAGPVALDLGAGLTYSPMPYDTMEGTQSSSLIGLRAVVGATYPVNPKIGLRGELGFGITKLGGLEEGNPFTTERQAASFTFPSLRLGVAADYAVTPNIVATVSPFGITLNGGNDELYAGSLREIDILVGVGYRM